MFVQPVVHLLAHTPVGTTSLVSAADATLVDTAPSRTTKTKQRTVLVSLLNQWCCLVMSDLALSMGAETGSAAPFVTDLPQEAAREPAALRMAAGRPSTSIALWCPLELDMVCSPFLRCAR